MIPMRSKKSPSTGPDLYDERYYINRELSWLEFNRRCLEEAFDKSNPLLERVKFLAICHSNMDEFFMIRVPGIIKRTPIPGPDYTSVNYNTLMERVSETVQGLLEQYSDCWSVLRSELSDKGIHIKRYLDLNADQKAWVAEFYRERVHALLTPLGLDVSHPFPFISNNALNIAVKLQGRDQDMYARVKVPIGVLPRFVKIPTQIKREEVYVFIEDIIENHISSLFPGLTVDGAYCFRVTRNADVKVTIDEACDFMSAVEESLEDRDIGFPVRMVVESEMPDDMVKVFGRNLGLHQLQIHRSESILTEDLWQIVGLDHPKLKDKPFEPYTPPELAEGMDLFDAIKSKDWILYHPYETFGTIVRFVNQAAEDPNVQSIKICLYRIGKDPSIVKALMRARENGKNVSVLMELRAKFDESNNILWARELEKIGVHVVYGPVDLKVHSKLLQVVRLEGNRLVRYTHMSSGNYNPSTAKQYGDISFLTADQEMGEDVGELFNALTGFFGPRMYKHLLVAPLTLKSSIIEKIEREISVCKETGSGYIALKANGLIDSDIIASLYKASIAGVKIDLNIRGLCCLRPGVAGISENITVTSIVDRFLEHSRIYYFQNGDRPEMYMGSSDMMPRNLLARVEVLFPVRDPDMMMDIREYILKTHLADNVKARVLLPDGSYIMRTRAKGEEKFRSQKWFLENKGIWHGCRRARDGRVHRCGHELHTCARRQVLPRVRGDPGLPGQGAGQAGQEPVLLRFHRQRHHNEERHGALQVRGHRQEHGRQGHHRLRHLRRPRGVELGCSPEGAQEACRRAGHLRTGGGQADRPRGVRKQRALQEDSRHGHRRGEHRGGPRRLEGHFLQGQPRIGDRQIRIRHGHRLRQEGVRQGLSQHVQVRGVLLVPRGPLTEGAGLRGGRGIVRHHDQPGRDVRVPPRGHGLRLHDPVRAHRSHEEPPLGGCRDAPGLPGHGQEPLRHHHPRRGHSRDADAPARHRPHHHLQERPEAGDAHRLRGLQGAVALQHQGRFRHRAGRALPLRPPACGERPFHGPQHVRPDDR
jgi:polyphosphate kinase